MIEIMKSGMCAYCTVADLELIETMTISGTRLWAIRCNHEPACERIEKELKPKEKRNEQKDLR